MSNEAILTCAVTGAHNNQDKHPDYPITPAQIANNCIDAAKAGAAIVHITYATPRPVYDPVIWHCFAKW